MFYGPSIASQNCNSLDSHSANSPTFFVKPRLYKIERTSKLESRGSAKRSASLPRFLQTRLRVAQAQILLSRISEKVGEFAEVSPNTFYESLKLGFDYRGSVRRSASLPTVGLRLFFSTSWSPSPYLYIAFSREEATRASRP